MKKSLVLLTLASIMLTSNTLVYASGGTSTTMNSTSTFTSELEPTDLSQIVVSVPDNLDLSLNSDKSKYVSSGNVSAKGTLKDGYQLSVSTNESVTYECSGKPDVAGAVTFGTQTWSSAQLEASKTTLDSRGISVEVVNSDDLAAGTYSTNILFNIGVSEAHVHTAGSPVVENRTQITYDNFDYYDNLLNECGIYDWGVGDYVYDEVVYCTSCNDEISRTTKIEHELTTTIENYVTPVYDVSSGEVINTTYNEVVLCNNCSYEVENTEKYITFTTEYDHYNNLTYNSTYDELGGDENYCRLEYTNPESGITEVLYNSNGGIYYEYERGCYWDYDGTWGNKVAFDIESFNDDPDFDYINNYDADYDVYDRYEGRLNNCPDKISDKFWNYHAAKGHWNYEGEASIDFVLPRYLCYDNSGSYPDYWEMNTSLAYQAFIDCVGIKSLTLPDTIKSIGDEAFSGCENLQSIEIPTSVTSIGSNVVDNCNSLTTINYDGTKAQFQSISGYENITAGVDSINVVCSNGTLSYSNGVLQ